METKQRKFYKINEKVWYKDGKQPAIIKSLDITTYDAVIELSDGITKEVKFWQLTKFKKPETKKEFKGLDHAFNQVKQFHKAFNHPVAYSPTFMPKERAEARMGWVKEEVQEFLDAKTVVDQADAMIDCMYFCLGTLVELGVYPQSVFDVVQNANMAKLWEDGKPRYREGDGKIIKPEGWQDPSPAIEKEIMKQASERKK